MLRLALLLLILVPRLALACTSSDAYSTAVCADSPVHYWRLDDSTNFADNGSNPVTLSNWTNPLNHQVTGLLGGGQSNTAVGFLGSGGGYIKYNAVSHGDISPDESPNGWSFEALASSDTATSQALMSNVFELGGGFVWQMWNCGAITLWQCGGGTFMGQSCTGAPANVAVHYVYTVNLTGTGSPRFRSYINGTLAQTTTSTSGTFCTTDNPAYMGRRGDGFNYLTGTLDEVAIYTSELTQTQVTNHYNAASLAAAGPVRKRIFQTSKREALLVQFLRGE